MTQVILLEDVDHLGLVGAMVNVAPGYARNFLLPRHKAIEVSARNKRQLAHHQRLLAARAAKSRASAEALVARLEKLTVTFPRKVGEQDKLFGSVTSMDVHGALQAEGVEVERRRIALDAPLRELGEFVVPVRVGAGLQAQLKVCVVAEAS